MRDQVVALLSALGVTVSAEDSLVDLIIQNVQFRIMNLTNQKDFPDGLTSIAVYMAAGEYLNMKKCSGQLTEFDLEAAEKQIKEGDTSITFALGEGSMTPEQRLNSLIDWMINGRSAELYRYRRLIW